MTLAALAGGLIVSIQPEAGSALNLPAVVALFAQCAVANGAAGVRIEGTGRIAAVRAAVAVPIVGLIKQRYDGFEPYITPTRADVTRVIDAGADIVAFDATSRARPEATSVAALIAGAHARGAMAMADCASADDMRAAAHAGTDIVATTLCGYTKETQGWELPALDLVKLCAGIGAFVVLEGGVATPAQAGAGRASGADAVVVGTAITNVDALVRSFATEVRART